MNNKSNSTIKINPSQINKFRPQLKKITSLKDKKTVIRLIQVDA